MTLWYNEQVDKLEKGCNLYETMFIKNKEKAYHIDFVGRYDLTSLCL